MRPEPIAIQAVEAWREHRAFCGLPRTLYRQDGHWVPPLRRDELRRWSPKHNASLAHRWQRRFIARRGGRSLGRVAAIRDPAFATRWAPDAGLIGFFECTDDGDVARALLDAAENALRDAGATVAIGPVNLTTHDEVGLLVDGYGARPAFLTPYNPPYYARLLEEAGYAPLRDYLGYRWLPGIPVAPAVARICARTDARLTVRPSVPTRFDRDAELLHRLYNASFAELWGFVPIERTEFLQRAAQFRPFYRPDLVLFAEDRGEPVGFALALPDINETLPLAHGRLFPLGWLRLQRGIPRIRSVRCLLVGVLPEHAGRGLGARLAVELSAAAARAGFVTGEMSLIQEGNRPMRRVIEAMGFRHSRTWRLYRKVIAG